MQTAYLLYQPQSHPTKSQAAAEQEECDGD